MVIDDNVADEDVSYSESYKKKLKEKILAQKPEKKRRKTV